MADGTDGRSQIQFPILAVTVSGGHTSLTLMRDHGKYKMLGETLDDAAGEAFDKVAKLLDLSYPGGPIVSKYAQQFRDKSIVSKTVFPRPILNDGTFNFSFSGLKTAVLQKVIDLKKQYGENLSEGIKQEICAAFEDAVVDVLVTKTMRAAEKFKPKTIILAGGVAANKTLRNVLELKIENCKLKIKFYVPDIKLCGDNAAMIGLAAYYHILRGDVSNWKDIKVDSNLELK
jgi:N6-L-threonylcarbamoyladenine synthase